MFDLDNLVDDADSFAKGTSSFDPLPLPSSQDHVLVSLATSFSVILSICPGASVPSAAQTVLQRVERMKAALTQKILNKEIEKLPYSEKELGEGAICASRFR